jgi:hypothetical protein
MTSSLMFQQVLADDMRAHADLAHMRFLFLSLSCKLLLRD